MKLSLKVGVINGKAAMKINEVMRLSEILGPERFHLLGIRLPAEMQKQRVMRYLMKKVKAGQWGYIKFYVTNLREKGIDWSELDTIERSVEIELKRDTGSELL